MIKSLKDLLDKFSRFTNSLVYDGGICKRLININNISFYYGKDSKGNDIYSTESFTLPPNSIKLLSFTHPEDVLVETHALSHTNA